MLAMNTELLAKNEWADAPEVTVHFFISGRDFDPDRVTNVLGIAPTEVWR